MGRTLDAKDLRDENVGLKNSFCFLNGAKNYIQKI